MSRSKKPKAPPKTRWEKSADRENARRWKRAPLFVHAGIVSLATPKERQARIEEGLRRSVELREQEQERLTKRAAELRAEMEAELTAEELAYVLERRTKYPPGPAFDINIWGEALDKKRGTSAAIAARTKEEQRGIARRVAAEQARQLSLFEVSPTPEEILSAPTPEKPKRRPCPDCGWTPAETPFVDNIHRRDCPGFMALLIGMWMRCPDCKAVREAGGRACEKHREAARACARQGHVAGPSTGPHESELTCQRCGVALPEIHNAVHREPQERRAAA